MPGPNLQINMPRMGPPVIASSAPVVNPNVPNMGPTSMMSPGQVAANAVDYNTLRGYIPHAGAGCRGCGPDGPSLRDVAPPSVFSRVPPWALWVGGIVGLGGTIGLIFWLMRRR